MSQLTNNTTALQALLEAVEALPAAGGGSVERKIATGEAKGDGTKVFTVTGLDFTPTHVIIAAVNDGTSSSGAQVAYTIGGYVGQVSIISGGGYAYPRFVTFDLADGSFTATITASSSSQKFATGNTYRWIAME